ncbi:MAG: MmgE/PrpD family protein [Pseudomonadota bacterium]
MLDNSPLAMTRIADFVLGDLTHVPETALRMAATLLLDTIGVAAGAANLPVSHIARNFAVDFQAAGSDRFSAPIMFDGRHASLAGAAYAAATQIDNLDGHDGYNPTKGHIGCAVVPALFAFASQKPELSGREALAILVMAYKVAARAGISLHATVSDYHTSGAWNALGVAAVGCRLQNTSAEILRHALGIAEYHGPRSQMMREIANPTMLHDGSGIGAMTGVNAAVLAARGFEGAPAITMEAPEVAHIWQDLDTDWTIERNYVKPYPVCRWAHAAIDATRQLMQDYRFSAGDVSSVHVNTFNEAAQLFAGMPQTTSQAQYSLAFAIAVMLHHGHIGPQHVSGTGLSDPALADLLPMIKVAEDVRHSGRFPAARWSDVTIELSDGQVLRSGDVHATGGPEAPMPPDRLRQKFDMMTAAAISPERASAVWSAGQGLLDDGSLFASLAAHVHAPADVVN